MRKIICLLQAKDLQLQAIHHDRDQESKQLASQMKAERRSHEAHLSQQRRLKEMGKESSLNYGSALFKRTAGVLEAELDATLCRFAEDPTKAGVHWAAIPMLDGFDSVAQIAAVGLTAAIDQLTRRQRLATFCQHIGWALEAESRLIRLRNVRPLEMRRLLRERMPRRALASPKVMALLHCPAPKWDDRARLQVGQFLFDHILRLGLLKVVRQQIGKTKPYFVAPTEECMAFVVACPPAAGRVSHTAMVCPPVPWEGLFGGGLLGSDDCLIKVPIADLDELRTTATEHYRQADMARIIAGVNHLQATPLEVHAELVEWQRITWDNGVAGLWPCAKVPMQMPERLGSDPSEEDLKARNALAYRAHRDQEIHRPKRIRIERSIQHMEALAGATIYQAWNADHRGRLYTLNRYVTHQGSDAEKAALSFLPKLPISGDGVDWLLKAAAGHWGMTRDTWADRLQWGRDHLPGMLAAAEDPLSRLELWRSAKDPWQFLQTCIGLKEAQETGTTGVPIRLDQTSSGPGILAALMRDAEVGRLCNLYGSTPKDLYGVGAGNLIARLRHDQEFWENPAQRALSQLWLDYGITRSTVKGAVLAAPYGGRHMSLTDGLVDLMAEHVGPVPLEEFAYRVAVPARYLAKHLWAEIKEQLELTNTLQKWLRTCTKKVMSQPDPRPLEWTTPMGWPMRVADRESHTTKVATELFGRKVSLSIADQPADAPLSYRGANKSISANFVHAVDAAFLQAIVHRAGEHSIPLLCNHDCFAVHPSHAGMTHQMLLDEMRRTFATDWLQIWHQEMQDKSGKKLPEPPMVNTLSPGLIGSNPYLFS